MGRPPLPLGTWGSIRRYPVGPDRWRAVTQFRDHDGRTRQVERHSPTGRKDKTGAAAERVLKEHLADRNSAGGGADLRPETPVSIAVALWLETLDRRPGTIGAYRYAADRYVLPAIGGIRLNEVTVATADKFIRAVTNEVGPGAARHARAVLSGVMATAARYGVVAANPVRDTAQIKARRDPTSALTDGERQGVLRALRADERAVELDIPDVIEFLAGSGLRIGEALALRFADVDLGASTAEIRATLVYVSGAGTIRQEQTKSTAGHRVIALPPELVAMVRRRLAIVWPFSEGLVFPNLIGRPRDPSAVRKELRRVAAAAGIERITPHAFRRSVATALDQAGLTARQIADHLGHSAVSMTTDRYMGRKVAAPEVGPLLSRNVSYG